MQETVTSSFEQIVRLRAYATRLTVALVFFGGFYVAAAVVLHSVHFGGLGLVLVTYLVAVRWARALAARAALELAAQVISYGAFYVCVGATAFVPDAYATLIVGCAMGIASALPYLRGRRLGAVFVTGLVGAFVVAVLGFVVQPVAMPPVVRVITCVGAPTWATYLLFSLLWQFSTRLRSTLDAERLAQARFSFLSGASEELGASLDPDAILRCATRAAVPTLADACVADAASAHGALARAHAGASPESIGADPEGASIDGAGVSSRSLVVPLAARGKAFGSILFGRSAGRAPFDAADVELAREFARRAAWALENARLYSEAQTANRVRDDFIATVSHELRTPLQAILGWSGVLRRRASDPAVLAKGLGIIDRSVAAQEKLVEDLLDVGRVMGGKLVIEPRVTDCEHVVRAALDAVRPMAAARGVEVELAIEPEVGTLFADADRIQQVVWNLLTNAVKFTPAGGHAEVSVRKVPTGVRITVRDSGEGIDPSFLPHVFDRFRQADGSSKRRHGGLGLGLAIVRQLVELHGGAVFADSEGVGKGATFVVELPRGAMTARADALPAEASPAIDGIAGVSVLVIDDDKDARELLAVVLEEAGALVRVAGSSREALEAVRLGAPDVVVSDIAMPEENGYELLAKLRALSARHQAWMPAIALTACASSQDRALALRRGFQVYLSKPVRPEAIVDAVAALCSLCQSHRSEPMQAAKTS